MSLSPLDITCTLCGTVVTTIQLDDSIDPDQFSFNPTCDACKSRRLAPQPQEYVAACPWCGTQVHLGIMSPGQRIKGECKAEGCDMPLEAWLEEDRLGHMAKTKKLFGGPKSVAVEGEPEWDV